MICCSNDDRPVLLGPTGSPFSVTENRTIDAPDALEPFSVQARVGLFSGRSTESDFVVKDELPPCEEGIPRHQVCYNPWFLIAKSIDQVTLKTVYFHYLKTSLLDHSIKKHFIEFRKRKYWLQSIAICTVIMFHGLY